MRAQPCAGVSCKGDDRYPARQIKPKKIVASTHSPAVTVTVRVSRPPATSSPCGVHAAAVACVAGKHAGPLATSLLHQR